MQTNPKTTLGQTEIHTDRYTNRSTDIHTERRTYRDAQRTKKYTQTDT